MEPEADEYWWEWEWKRELDEMEERIEFRGETTMAERLRTVYEGGNDGQ